MNINTAIVIAVCSLALAMGTFLVRYALRAPWWRSFEGRVIFSSYTLFLAILSNLIAFRLLRHSAYEEILVTAASLAAATMIGQNLALTRARRKAYARSLGERLRGD